MLGFMPQDKSVLRFLILRHMKEGFLCICLLNDGAGCQLIIDNINIIGGIKNEI